MEKQQYGWMLQGYERVWNVEGSDSRWCPDGWGGGSICHVYISDLANRKISLDVRKTCCDHGRWKERAQDNDQAGFGIRPFLINLLKPIDHVMVHQFNIQ